MKKRVVLLLAADMAMDAVPQKMMEEKVRII